MSHPVVKAHLLSPDGSMETRRFPIPENFGTSGLFKMIYEKIGNTFTELEGKSYCLKWKDSDGDLILMSSDEEMKDAMSNLGNSSLYVYIQIDEPKTIKMTKLSEASKPAVGSETKKDNGGENDWPCFSPFGFPSTMMGPSPPLPPPFPFYHDSFQCPPEPFHGKWKHGHPHMGPGMGFHGGSMGPGPFGIPHHWGGFGGRGGHHPHGGHHHRGFRHGDRDHHHGGQYDSDEGHQNWNEGHHNSGKGHHHGDKGHHHGSKAHRHGGEGHHHDHHHNWVQHDSDEGHHHDHPHHWSHRHGGRGHHHGHHNGDGAHQAMECGPGEQWKSNLRTAVPLLHRKWAKMFIQKWRQENLANATTTTSDSGTDDELTMEKAGVPEAYQKWLKLMLPKWHKKWSAHKGSFEANEGESEGEISGEERKVIKFSVPQEFRKWSKWYLRRHYGPRMAPRFRGNFGRCCQQNESDQMEICGGKRKINAKLRIIASLVPASHRIWAKKFIHDWRVNKKLQDPSACTSSSNESEDDTHGEDEAVPEDYAKWLERFLPKWHNMRGLIEKSDFQENQGCKGKFKDTVPNDFRTWIKVYLCMHYGKQRQNCCPREMDSDVMLRKYRGWMRIFKKKWLEEQASIDEKSDDMFSTSGDDSENPKHVPSDNNGEVPIKSFKKIRLSDDESGEIRHKSVQFDPSSYQSTSKQSQQQKKMMKSMMENDNGLEEMEIRRGRRKCPAEKEDFRFQKWAWHELDNWEYGDDQSMNDNNSSATTAEEMQDIPPNVYWWMFKTMRKLERKKMKQQMKAVKREMKASQKQAKALMKAARKDGSFEQ